MDISNYLHDIPALIMTAIAALGGTATAIGTLFAWVSKVVKSLKAGKADYESKATDYEEKAQRLEERSAKLSATGETFEKFGATLTAYGEDFARLVAHTNEQSNATDAKFEALASALLLIAENTPLLVQNGTAENIKRLLRPDETNNAIEEIHSEVTDGEVDA